MKLSEIGEFGFIKRLSLPFVQNLPDGIVGIGDDCAVVQWRDETSLLVTTDMLIEGIHFLRAKISPRDLGYKSLAVNLSDIAAMGGTPMSAFISIGIPNEIEVEWLDDFYGGLHELAEAESVSLLGGDTTKSPADLVINLAVIGTEKSQLVKYRSTARPGDLICVTDFLGDSACGLRMLLENMNLENDDSAFLVRRHNRPRAQLAEGAWLAAQSGVHAMMDVSDGIDSDLQRIMDASCCGGHVQIERLPLSPQLQRISLQQKWDAIEFAVAGGEDYCLLATIDPARYRQIADGFGKKFSRPLTTIGTILKNERDLVYTENEKHYELHNHGFDHFAPHAKIIG